MSLQPFFDNRRPTTTEAPVRVFPAVAALPRLPEPGRWIHPLGIMLVTMVLSVGLTWITWLPGFTGLVVMLLGIVLTVGCAVSYLKWSDSREKAAAEGVWVARQCGYRASAQGEELRWLGPHGVVKAGHIVRGPKGWDLVLTDQDAGTTA